MATEHIEKDLPIEPISHLILTFSFFNATDEGTLIEVLGFINKITVAKLGVPILSLESEDLYAQNCYLFGRRPVLTAKIGTDNYARSLTLMVPMGRKLYDPKECFPATKKGELTLDLDTTVPATTLDNAVVNIETVSLPGATPSRYLKSTMQTITAPGSTGDNDVDLPLGNDIVAMCLRLTTWLTAATHTLGVDYLQLLVNDNNYGYQSAHMACLMGDLVNIIDTQHGAIAAQGLIQPSQCVFLDFDPRRNDEFLLQTAGKTSAKLRLEMGVDEATYLSLYELVKV
jgi:hypothetical protein